MKRVLFFTGHRMTVYHWQDKRLLAKYSFTREKESFTLFEKYLRTVGKDAVQILVDIIEEDLNQSEQPHLFGHQRKRYSARRARKLFSTTPYRYFEYQGRSREGRKDDIMLYTGLSNPELLSPWIHAINTHSVSVSGITSLPILSSALMKKLGLGQDHLLLLCQQAPATFRQVYFHKGKVRFSRLAAVRREDSANIGQFIAEDVQHTLGYLRAKHFLGAEAAIDVLILQPREALAEVSAKLQSKDAKTAFTAASIEQVSKTLGVSDTDFDFCDNIFSYLATSTPCHSNHYGDDDLRLPYRQASLHKGLYAAGTLILAATALVAVLGSVDAYVSAGDVPRLSQQAEFSEGYYQRNFGARASEIQRAADVRNAVEWSEFFHNTGFASLPTRALGSISLVLEDQRLSSVHVDAVEWALGSELSQGDMPAQEAAGQFIDPSMPSDPGFADPGMGNPGPREAGVRHTVRIAGQIDVDPTNYRAMLDTLEVLRTKLAAKSVVSEVIIEKAPVDMSSSGAIKGSLGAQPESSKEAGEAGRFALLIRFRESVS